MQASESSSFTNLLQKGHLGLWRAGAESLVLAERTGANLLILMYFRHRSRMESHLINCLYMEAEPTILTLSNTAFWDTDMHKLDMDQHKDFIIARVFMHGSLEDYKLVLLRYTREEIKHALQQYRGLDKLTSEFAETLGFL